MPELEIDALQAFEVADLEFRNHGAASGVCWSQFSPICGKGERD
jgi:hypothetical protein